MRRAAAEGRGAAGSVRCLLVSLGVLLHLGAHGVQAGPVGEWIEVPNSRLTATLPSPLPDVGYGNPRAITEAWSGGALDTKRNQLLVWGGGHADYGGNEVYAFRLATRSWTRLTDPSPTTRDTVEALADGRPASRHTYSGLVYLPLQDRMLAAGGSLWFDGRGTKGTWTFDPQTGNWQRRADMPSSQLTAMAAYDEKTGEVYALQQNGHLVAYEVAKDAWSRRGGTGGWAGFDPARTMVVHPTQRKLLVVGGGVVLEFDLRDANAVAHTVSTQGGAPIVGAQGPGLAYDPVLDRIVGWAGGGDVYSLDPMTRIWERHPAAGAAVPPAAPRQGIYGRFQYVPSARLYVGVTGIDQNVFLFRFRSPQASAATMTELPKRPPLSLPVRTWVARELPPRDQGPLPRGQGGKHSRLLYDSARGRMVLTGGDYSTAAGSGNGNSFVWAITLDQGDAWTLLAPYCAAPGGLQPGGPDNVVWVYDSRRDRAVIMPGFYFVTQGERRCPEATESAESLLFDFTTNRWEPPTYGPPPGGYGGDLGATYGVYDPQSDAAFRFRWDGGWGNVMEILSLARNTWETVRLGSGEDALRNTNARADQSAIDVDGRSIYVISRRSRALLKYSIARKRVVETIPMPAQWVAPLGPEHETWMTFDPIHRVLLIPVNGPSGYEGTMLGLAIFHVDTKRWEWEAIPARAGGPTVKGNVVGFDVANNALMLIGGHGAVAFWLYRYAD